MIYETPKQPDITSSLATKTNEIGNMNQVASINISSGDTLSSAILNILSENNIKNATSVMMNMIDTLYQSLDISDKNPNGYDIDIVLPGDKVELSKNGISLLRDNEQVFDYKWSEIASLARVRTIHKYINQRKKLANSINRPSWARGGKKLGDINNKYIEALNITRTTNEKYKKIQELSKSGKKEEARNILQYKMTGKEIYALRMSIKPSGMTYMIKQIDLKYDKNQLISKIRGKAISKNINPNIAEAILSQESNYGRALISRTGALGPMQLTSWVYLYENGEKNSFNPINPFDINSAVERSLGYLSHLQNIGGSNRYMVGAYHSGPANSNDNGANTYWRAIKKQLTTIAGSDEAINIARA